MNATRNSDSTGRYIHIWARMPTSHADVERLRQIHQQCDDGPYFRGILPEILGRRMESPSSPANE